MINKWNDHAPSDMVHAMVNYNHCTSFPHQQLDYKETNVLPKFHDHVASMHQITLLVWVERMTWK